MARESIEGKSTLKLEPAGRLEPPSGLTKDEAVLWRNVVDSKPAEWFQADSAPLLTEYVRAVATCDQLAKRVKEALKYGNEQVLGKVLDMRDKEAKRAAQLATKLRLTQQSRYTPQAAATADRKASGKRPWERTG